MELILSSEDLQAIADASTDDSTLSLNLSAGECALELGVSRYILNDISTRGYFELRGVRFKLEAIYEGSSLTLKVDE